MTPPRKVLEVLSGSTGGIAGHVADITEGLQAHTDLKIDVAAPPDLPVTMPTEVIPLIIPDGVVGHRRAIGTLRQLIAVGNYEVVHGHGLRAAVDTGRATRSRGAVALATVHNLVLPEISGQLRSKIYSRVEPLAVRWNDHLFAPSSDIARRLRTSAPGQADKVEVLHIGVPAPFPPPRDRGEVRAELGLNERDHLLVTVARLAPQKALHVLLEAMGSLPEHVYLAIIGSGPLESRLKALASTAGLEQRVTFLGHRKNPQDQIAAADVFCLSSLWEACSLAAQEAIRLRVPVVSTDVGGMPELIEDRFSGRLVPPGDPAHLSAAVGELLKAPEERHRLAGNALRHLEVHFSHDSMLDRLAYAYRRQDLGPP
jgi:glycosyltransferase involved in cell wall biosynthesis